ncbi:MAG: ssuB [Firmicutes bacterium]|jgi:sulfonate transport system ATP-binding protein|nr:ssuB [Bacillota bacterium]
MNDENYVSIQQLSKSYQIKNRLVVALKNICLCVAKHEFVSIIGTSGCGKSTLLRIVCGLDTDYSGKVIVNGNIVVGAGLNCGMVFQEHRLLPWLTVAENITFALHDKTKTEKVRLVEQYLDLVGLQGVEGFYPKQLSGGMAQRVAIARSLVNKPNLLLLDEPLGALDALTRLKMQQILLRIWEKEKTTMLMVTHDIDEAIYLGNRVVLLSESPGTIKKEFLIPKGIDRSDTAFVKMRDEIYHEF